MSELRELLAKATPELFTAKPHRIAQMLRDGAHAQVPRADNLSEVDFDADAALIVVAVNELPALLDRIEQLEAALRYYAEDVNAALCEDRDEHGYGRIARAALRSRQSTGEK